MKYAVLVFLPLAVAVQAQTPVKSTLPVDSSPAVNLPSQKIGIHDLVSLSVQDCPELTRNFRVSPDGTLPLPLLKERIHVAGKYPAEVETDLTNALVGEGLLVQPVVAATVAEYRSVPVSVMGAVKHPLTFQAIGETSLLDALSRADGLAPTAGSEILVSKPNSVTRRISVKALLENSDPSLNMSLQGGEEIRVPEAGRVYVVGNVKKPGAFPVGDGGDTTVLKVLALSEGLLPYSGKEAFIYRREGGKSNRNELPVELSRIMDRKLSDVALLPDDILYIPDNKHRRMAMGTLERLAGFGASTASGVLIFK
jgi:polysaccharide biosynthesis/export protein